MTTVLCHGVFDIVHPGHLEHFKQAKQHGDKLIVAIVADAYVRKGPGHPMFNQHQRAEFLGSLQLVDGVVIVNDPTALPILELLRPAVFCKGSDYLQAEHPYARDFQREKAFVEGYGGKVILTSGFTASSTELIDYLHAHDSIIDQIRQTYGLQGVLAWLDKAHHAKALVIGEEIIDEYVYVESLFKSGKENIVAFTPTNREKWAGGAAVVEAHLMHFAQTVQRVNHNPPIHKLRYVDNAFQQKLFSVVDIPSISPMILSSDNWDDTLVVVADYGHGLIDRKAAHAIANKPPGFLAITVQSNSANWGFNLLTKWPRADYVVLDRNELQLAAADRDTPIESLMAQWAAKVNAQYFAVTLGHKGCLVSCGAKLVELPALSNKVVDRMGAGDAFLAATAPLAWAGAPSEIIALIGNVAGAIKVGKLGNQVVTRSEVEECLQQLLA